MNTTSEIIDAYNGCKCNGGGGGEGSDKFALISVTASDFGSGSKSFGYIIYATRDSDSGEWIIINDSDYSDPYYNIWGESVPYSRYLPPIPVPNSDSYAPFLMVTVGNAVTTGDILNPPGFVYTSYGSPIPGDAYLIFGNGSVEFVNTL